MSPEPNRTGCSIAAMKAIVALDQGTTGSTAIVVDETGAVRGRATVEIAPRYPRPGWVEQDPDELWVKSVEALAGAVADAALPRHSIVALGLTNQRETTVVWDRATGRPVHPAIVWQSRQSEDVCRGLRADGFEPELRRRTGLVLDPYFSATKVRWILDRDPELQQRAEDGELLFGTVDTWILHRLTDGRVHATDPTNASRTLLFDPEGRDWDTRLLEVFGVPRSMLPDVRPSAGSFGETAAGPLPLGLPITALVGDQQGALFGQAGWTPGVSKATFGTGGFVLLNAGGERPPDRDGLLTTLCCGADGSALWGLEGSIFVAGAAVQWLRDELGLLRSAAESEAVAREVASTDGVFLVPAFSGLGSPWWDPDARGALVGLTRGSGRAHLVRAALESMAFQTVDVLDAMTAGSEVGLEVVRVDGGAAENGLMLQTLADLAGVEVERPAVLETTAQGAAWLAGVGVGLWESPDVPAAGLAVESRFEPRISSDERSSRLAAWRDAVRRVRSDT